MITVRRVMGVETEYALIDRDDPAADPETLASQLLYAYARQAAAEGAPSTLHVPAEDSRELEWGAGCRFDYSGELPTRDARDGRDHVLAREARTDLEAGAVLTGAPVRWIQRVDRFGQHYYRGSATHTTNGARIYVDHTHPEYAAPEAYGPWRRCVTTAPATGSCIARSKRCRLGVPAASRSLRTTPTDTARPGAPTSPTRLTGGFPGNC